ncbi:MULTISPECIES: hypothetical protein [Cyanophyceae]|uniref:hypothetical protein n=1 Tax=Cyanophyceae TaxID=3028117 RepID=UPI0002A66F11|nr:MULTISPECIES: hypothetical protein [Cyanophyceae]AFZ33519.1 hypothetical protein Glo7428_5136 [Gloeocapsa sp. PCC 7428]PPS42026.1 hypothetical protein B1A85_16310 [Chroococcidiopsis sp. TS-821]
MTLMRFTTYTNKRRFNRINRFDVMFIVLLLAVTAYLLIQEPLMVAILGCASIVYLGLYNIGRAIPLVEKWINAKIRFWHVATAIIGTTCLFTLFDAPAHALFLSGLEDFVGELVNASNSGVDTGTVGTVFNMIRAIFLLLVVAAGLFAYNQAQQGNDWRPIATQVALAFGIVIGLDIITLIFTGA